jgi:hypothetical protein
MALGGGPLRGKCPLAHHVVYRVHVHLWRRIHLLCSEEADIFVQKNRTFCGACKGYRNKEASSKITAQMSPIYVTSPIKPPQLPVPANQLTAHNINVDSFVTIGKAQLHQLTMMALLCFFSL